MFGPAKLPPLTGALHRCSLNRISVLSEIGVDLQRYSEKLRSVLEDWSVEIFAGRPDANNSTILYASPPPPR